MNIDKLNDILLSENPSVKIKENEKEIFEFIPELEICKGFNQNSKWHIYDVYTHILKVIDGVPSDLMLRYAALFHDIGKPVVYSEDENGVGHFYGHFNESANIFLSFSKKYNLDNEFTLKVKNLVYFHDYRLGSLTNKKLKEVLSNFNKEELKKLYRLKRADLLAQNPKYHYMLSDYEDEEKRLTLYL